MTTRCDALKVFAASIVAAPIAARAQSARKIPIVGFLTLAGAESLAQFQDAMRDLGYVEGRNVVIERRSSEGKADVLPALAAEFVNRKVDVLYATGPAAVKAAHNATSAIPIVALDLETDPVASGLVRSLGRPGGNVTGLFLDLPSLAGKWLELLGEAAPGRERVGVLWDSTTGTAQLMAARTAAQRLVVELHILEIRAADELDQALRGALDGTTRAMMVLSSPLISGNSKRIAEFTTQNRLPAISPFRVFAEAGGLMSYGPDLLAFRRISATYVDKILKGAKAAELPIQQPTTFQFVVNQNAAKALGLTIPQSLLLRADVVIQ